MPSFFNILTFSTNWAAPLIQTHKPPGTHHHAAPGNKSTSFHSFWRVSFHTSAISTQVFRLLSHIPYSSTPLATNRAYECQPFHQLCFQEQQFVSQANTISLCHAQTAPLSSSCHTSRFWQVNPHIYRPLFAHQAQAALSSKPACVLPYTDIRPDIECIFLYTACPWVWWPTSPSRH